MPATIHANTHAHLDNDFLQSFLTARVALAVELKELSEAVEASEQITAARREAFCESLMDYVALGHFGLYERLFNDTDGVDESRRQLARRFYPLMMRGVQLALLFNDHNATDADYAQSQERLAFELSEIGLMLNQRFTAEDQILAGGH